MLSSSLADGASAQKNLSSDVYLSFYGYSIELTVEERELLRNCFASFKPLKGTQPCSEPLTTDCSLSLSLSLSLSRACSLLLSPFFLFLFLVAYFPLCFYPFCRRGRESKFNLLRECGLVLFSFVSSSDVRRARTLHFVTELSLQSRFYEAVL